MVTDCSGNPFAYISDIVRNSIKIQEERDDELSSESIDYNEEIRDSELLICNEMSSSDAGSVKDEMYEWQYGNAMEQLKEYLAVKDDHIKCLAGNPCAPPHSKSERLFILRRSKIFSRMDFLSSMSKERTLFKHVIGVNIEDLTFHLERSHLVTDPQKGDPLAFDMPERGKKQININMRNIHFYYDKVEIVLFELLTLYIMERNGMSYKNASKHIYDKDSSLPTYYHEQVMNGTGHVYRVKKCGNKMKK